MSHLTFKKLKITDADRISEIDASIYIKNAWRDIDGKKQLICIDYHEEGFPNGIDEHIEALKHTLVHHGYAIGAFNEQNHLIGFASLNRKMFGKAYRYVLLDQLFISKPYRKRGIGKALMKMCMDEARLWGANKLYICAGSSEDTVAFYRSLGYVEAIEINQELFESDPRDFQLEYKLEQK